MSHVLGIQIRVRPTGRRSFYAVENIVGYPLFLCMFGLVAVAGLTSSSGWPFGLAAAALVVYLIRGALQQNFVATVDQDGTLTFKGLGRSTTTRVSDIRRIGYARFGHGAHFAYVFTFTGGSASLGGGLAPRALTRLILTENPSVSDQRPAWAQRR